MNTHAKKTLISLLIIGHHLSFAATQQGQPQQAPTQFAPYQTQPFPPGAYPVYVPISQPNVTVYGNGQATATNNNAAHQSNHQLTQQSQRTTTTVHHEVSHKVHHNVEHKIVLPTVPTPDFQSATDSIQNKLQALRAWCAGHKWYIVSGVIVGIYCNTLYQLMRIHNVLEKHDAWCLWRQTVPLSQLATSGREDLFKQLQLDIHKKYYRSLPSANSQTVYNLFFQDINEEQAKLESYTKIYSICKTTYSARLFPFRLKHRDIEERQARLEFVIDLFMTWYAEQEK